MSYWSYICWTYTVYQECVKELENNLFAIGKQVRLFCLIFFSWLNRFKIQSSIQLNVEGILEWDLPNIAVPTHNPFRI